MSDKTVHTYDKETQTYVPVLYHDNGDGTYSEAIFSSADNVALGTKADAPADTVQDATPRTGITLFKTIANYLRTLAAAVSANLVQIRALTSADVVTVSNPTTNPETGLAKDGTDITTPTAMPAGGSGIRGWLSAIWTKLNGSLAVTGTFFQTTQPVSGRGFSIPITLTVTNGAYTIGDVVGGLITLPNIVSANGKRSIIYTVTLVGVSAIAYNLIFRTADIIAGTIADNGTYSPAAADGANFVGSIKIESTDYVAAASAFNMATCPPSKALGVHAGAATTTLYAYLVATEVTSPGTTTLYANFQGEYVD